MHTYLSDLTWCLREANFTKIKNGKYDKAWSKPNKKASAVKENTRDDSEKFKKKLI